MQRKITQLLKRKERVEEVDVVSKVSGTTPREDPEQVERGTGGGGRDPQEEVTGGPPEASTGRMLLLSIFKWMH